MENHAEGFGNIANPNDQNDQAKHQIGTGHERNNFFGYRGNAINAADEDDARENRNENADDPAGDAKGIGASFTDGIGLHHAAHKAKGQNDGDRKKCSHKTTKIIIKSALDVVDRAAGNASVFVDYFCILSQNGFCVDGCHAEESDDPHPEDCAGATNQNSTAGTDDVSGTDLSCNSSCQRLKGTDAAFMLAAVKGKVAEHAAHTFPKAAHLNKAGANREEKSTCNQHDDQNVVRQIAVNCLHNVK